MLSNLQILAMYLAAVIALFFSWSLRPIRKTAKSPSALVGWLTLAWLLCWFPGMLIWLAALVVSGSATFPALWTHAMVIALGEAALVGALLLIGSEAMRTCRAVARSSARP
jgi:hypothetical protein